MILKTEKYEQAGSILKKDAAGNTIRVPVMLQIENTYHDNGRKDVTVTVPKIVNVAKVRRK